MKDKLKTFLEALSKEYGNHIAYLFLIEVKRQGGDFSEVSCFDEEEGYPFYNTINGSLFWDQTQQGNDFWRMMAYSRPPDNLERIDISWF